MKFSGLMVGCLVFMLTVGLVSNSRAATGYASGTPWQIGDIVVCFGSGTCNVLRINPDSSVTLLDQFSDGLASASDTRGVAINNTLHALVTDNTDDSQSDVTVFSIASVNPGTGTAVAHKAVSTFTANGPANSGNNAQAVVVDQTGHVFIGNAGSGGTALASIVELNPDGTLAPAGTLHTNPLALTGSCAPDFLGQRFSMDLSADGTSLYFTSNGGKIQKLNLTAGTCTPFANFGSSVTLYGIKDIPAGALTHVSPNCNGIACPTDEAVLVVATGFTDPDAAETGENPLPNDPDAINICTNKQDGNPVSCGLLLDTNSSLPGLTAPFWVPNGGPSGALYRLSGVKILDPYLHVQTVTMPGTSGADEPSFNRIANGTTLDNAIVWTDQGVRQWGVTEGAPPVSYAFGDVIIDPAKHVQQVTKAGSSGTTQPSWNESPPPSFGGKTTDGVKWTDQGAFPWTPSTIGTFEAVSLNQVVVDPLGHVQKATTVYGPGLSTGTSGPASLSPPTQPFNGWNEGAQTTDGLTWMNMGPPPQPNNLSSWTPNTPYFTVGSQVLDNLPSPCPCVEQVVTPGVSTSAAQPATGWNPSLNGITFDNTVIWTDEGGWTPAHPYSVGNTVGDTNFHLWQVAIGGMSDPSTPPAFVANELPGSGFVYENNAVIWTDRGNWQPNTPYPIEGMVGDASLHLEQVIAAPVAHISSATESGTLATITTTAPHGFLVGQQVTIASVPGAGYNGMFAIAGVPNPTQFTYTAASSGLGPSGAPGIAQVNDAGTSGPGPMQPIFPDVAGATTIDGLVWTYVSSTTPSLVARYPVTGVSTIQSLALDPLVIDCTTGCTTLMPPGAPMISNFWLGDNGSFNIYKLDFATGANGSPTAINANGNESTVCSATCTSFNSVHGLDVYGAEGSNQPDLTKLFTTGSFAPSPNTQAVQFPLPVNPVDTNTMTVALFPTTASNIPLSIYASQLPMAASLANGGNNSGATDPPGSFPCEPSTSIKANCILWKIDANPVSGTKLATKFSTVNTTPPTIDTNTDVFVDENYDVTTFIGNFDPGGTRLSVHSLNEVASFTGTSGGSCAYKSPAPKCFQNPGNITFKFSCPTFTGSVGSLQPVLTLVTPPPGTPGSFPQPVTLVPTDSNPPNYRFDGTQWVFNWQSQNGTFRATTIDETHQIQTFYEDFTVASSCSSTMTVSSITPNTGTVQGGTKFTLVGTGFAANATVTFVGAGPGPEQATGVTVASNGKSLTGFAPKAANAGPIDIKVINPPVGVGGSATLFDGYIYTP